MLAVLSLLSTSFSGPPSVFKHVAVAQRAAVSMMPEESGRPGTPADLGDYEEYQFAKATTDDGKCFIVDDDESPDDTRSWFYCDDPALDDEDMECELVPEWMGTSPSGDHAVWLCSKPKPS